MTQQAPKVRKKKHDATRPMHTGTSAQPLQRSDLNLHELFGTSPRSAVSTEPTKSSARVRLISARLSGCRDKGCSCLSRGHPTAGGPKGVDDDCSPHPSRYFLSGIGVPAFRSNACLQRSIGSEGSRRLPSEICRDLGGKVSRWCNLCRGHSPSKRNPTRRHSEHWKHERQSLGGVRVSLGAAGT